MQVTAYIVTNRFIQIFRVFVPVTKLILTLLITIFVSNLSKCSFDCARLLHSENIYLSDITDGRLKSTTLIYTIKIKIELSD